MKLTENALNSLMEQDAIQFEEHERVPFFIITTESVLTDEEGNLINVYDNYYTEEHQGIIYAKMDSDAKYDGKFIGQEPTFTTEMNLARQAIWKEQLGTAISATQMQEIRRVTSMWETLEGAKEIAIETVNEYLDDLSTQQRVF